MKPYVCLPISRVEVPMYIFDDWKHHSNMLTMSHHHGGIEHSCRLKLDLLIPVEIFQKWRNRWKWKRLRQSHWSKSLLRRRHTKRKQKEMKFVKVKLLEVKKGSTLKILKNLISVPWAAPDPGQGLLPGSQGCRMVRIFFRRRNETAAFAESSRSVNLAEKRTFAAAGVTINPWKAATRLIEDYRDVFDCILSNLCFAVSCFLVIFLFLCVPNQQLHDWLILIARSGFDCYWFDPIDIDWY